MPQYSEIGNGANRVEASTHDSGVSENNANTSGTADLNRLLNSTACNISLGVVLLLIGIVVTSMTFKEYRSTNKIFLLGPVLVGAGVLGIGKAILKKYHFRDNEHHRRRRRRTRPLNSQRRDSESLEENTDSSTRPLRDAPPPYDIVAIVTTSRSALLPTPQSVVHVPSLPNYSEIDPLPPPPKYEEVIEGQYEQIDTSGSSFNDISGVIVETGEEVPVASQESSSNNGINCRCNATEQIREDLSHSQSNESQEEIPSQCIDQDEQIRRDNNNALTENCVNQTVQNNSVSMQNQGASNLMNNQQQSVQYK